MTAPMPLRVDTELALHPREARDADEMFALVNRHRAALREWLAWPDATRSPADARRNAHFASAQFENLTAFGFAIRANGAIVGAIDLHALDWSNRSAQIGYWLAPDSRGRGIVTRAAAALVAHAFTKLELHRLEIRCVIENAPSRAVAQRLGFRFEGTLAGAYTLHGTFRDIALYAATADRYELR